MKRSILRLAAAVLSGFVLLMALPMSASADGEADYNGMNATDVWQIRQLPAAPVYTYNGGAPIIDFFGAITKNLVPGDVRTVSVLLNNNAAQAVTFYLTSTPVTHMTEPSSVLMTTEGSFDNKDPLLNDELLENVLIDVACNGVTLSRTLRDEWVLNIGSLASGAYCVIEVTVTIKDLDNSFMDSFAAVQWAFRSESTEDGGGVNPRPTVTPTPTVTTSPPVEDAVVTPDVVNVEDDAPPLGDYEEDTVTIPDEEVPKTDFEVVVVEIPRTGDYENLTLLIAIASIALIGMVALLVLTLRKPRKESVEQDKSRIV